MDLAVQKRLARRLVDFARNGSTDLADDTLEVSTDSYLDERVWRREVELFKRLPIVACLSSELAEPGTYFAQTLVDVPVLITRDERGQVNAFLNVCSHRGAKVAADSECALKGRRFTCPYHGWSYDADGRLIGVQEPALFGTVDRASHGLTRLQADERLGIVFVILTPGVTHDIDEYLAGVPDFFGDHAAGLEFVGSRTVKAGHWKLVVEGHLESYHFSTLHRDSIAPFMLNNRSASDKFESHNLITFSSKSLEQMADQPEDEWRPVADDHISPQFNLFPGTMAVLFPDALMLQMIRPGATPDASTSRLALAARPGSAMDETKLDFVARLVEDEDYTLSHDILRGMRSGARRAVVFGKNEVSAHHFHEILEKRLAEV